MLLLWRMFILNLILTFSTCFRLTSVRAGLRIRRLVRRGCLAWRARGRGEGRVVHARPGRLDGRGELEKTAFVLARDGRKRAAGALDLGIDQHVQKRHDARRVGVVDVHLDAPVGERPVQVRAQ